MSKRAEEAASAEYPFVKREFVHSFGVTEFDGNYDMREAFQKGYEQAEKDMNPQEQPEVDLDFSMFAKEMDVVFNLPEEVTKNTEQNPLNWEYAIARHFYELGFNARKEE